MHTLLLHLGRGGRSTVSVIVRTAGSSPPNMRPLIEGHLFPSLVVVMQVVQRRIGTDLPFVGSVPTKLGPQAPLFGFLVLGVLLHSGFEHPVGESHFGGLLRWHSPSKTVEVVHRSLVEVQLEAARGHRSSIVGDATFVQA